MRGLDDAQVTARVKAAAEHLSANWHPGLGVVGFSLGGAIACELAQQQPVEATVVYYGFTEVDPARWHGPVLGHFAENDPWADVDEDEVFKALNDAGVEAECHRYPGTGHWFANSDVADAHDPDASEVAFQRTVDFFHHHLA